MGAGEEYPYEIDMRRTELHKAALDGDLPKVKELIRKRVKIDPEDANRDTPLTLAMNSRHFEVADLILKAGADIDHQSYPAETQLFRASARGDLEAVKFLLNHRAKVDIRNYGTDMQGATEFLAAAGHGHLAIAKLLKEKGADIWAEDRYGDNVYHYIAKGAWSERHIEVLTWLKAEWDAMPNKPMVRILLNREQYIESGEEMRFDYKPANNPLEGRSIIGQHVNWIITGEPARPGPTPFLIAAEKGRVLALKWFSDNGADIHAVDRKKRTGLHLSVISLTPQAVKLLLEMGLDPFAVDEDGKTARDLANDRRRNSNDTTIKQIISILKAAERQRRMEARSSAKSSGPTFGDMVKARAAAVVSIVRGRSSGTSPRLLQANKAA